MQFKLSETKPWILFLNFLFVLSLFAALVSCNKLEDDFRDMSDEEFELVLDMMGDAYEDLSGKISEEFGTDFSDRERVLSFVNEYSKSVDGLEEMRINNDTISFVFRGGLCFNVIYNDALDDEYVELPDSEDHDNGLIDVPELKSDLYHRGSVTQLNENNDSYNLTKAVKAKDINDLGKYVAILYWEPIDLRLNKGDIQRKLATSYTFYSKGIYGKDCTLNTLLNIGSQKIHIGNDRYIYPNVISIATHGNKLSLDCAYTDKDKNEIARWIRSIDIEEEPYWSKILMNLTLNPDKKREFLSVPLRYLREKLNYIYGGSMVFLSCCIAGGFGTTYSLTKSFKYKGASSVLGYGYEVNNYIASKMVFYTLDEMLKTPGLTFMEASGRAIKYTIKDCRENRIPELIRDLTEQDPSSGFGAYFSHNVSTEKPRSYGYRVKSASEAVGMGALRVYYHEPEEGIRTVCGLIYGKDSTSLVLNNPDKDVRVVYDEINHSIPPC